jgi:CBS domain-containing protein
MKVEQILQSKGVEVYAVSENQTIGEAVSVLDDKNIGAVVVKDGRGVVSGILSERDVVRRLRAEGSQLLAKRVGDCMTKDPLTCSMHHSIDDVMSVMTKRRVRHLPVVDGDRLVGLVSIGDVVKRKIEDAEREAAALKDYIAS